ncbi:MAG TPA: ribosome-binding factor A [Acidimicrobiales bacterium]
MPSNSRRYPRTARVNELLREIIAEALEEMADEDGRLDLVTITGVDADTDLSRATVFFSARNEGAEDALNERRWKLQSEINRQARFKRTPQLAFVEDPGVTSGWRIEAVLRDLQRTEAREPEDEAGS